MGAVAAVLEDVAAPVKAGVLEGVPVGAEDPVGEADLEDVEVLVDEGVPVGVGAPGGAEVLGGEGVPVGGAGVEVLEGSRDPAGVVAGVPVPGCVAAAAADGAVSGDEGVAVEGEGGAAAVAPSAGAGA